MFRNRKQGPSSGTVASTLASVAQRRREQLKLAFQSSSSSPAATEEQPTWRSIALFLWSRIAQMLRSRVLVLSLLSGGFVYFLLRTLFPRRPKRPLPTVTEHINLNPDYFDVVVIGAGPAGSTTAYYLAKAGKKVLVLDRHRPVADKVCGDCITPAAQEHLAEMGVMHEIQAEMQGRWSRTGGFVSPNGNSFISDFNVGREICVQRVVLDEKIGRAAVRAGATVRYRHEVTVHGICEIAKVQLRKSAGMWHITCMAGEQNEEVAFKSRMLVAADGAASRIARLLSVVTTSPNAAAARSFVRAGTHSFKADKVVFYHRKTLPGFTVVFHELEDYLSVTTFVTPGCSARVEQTPELHNQLLESDPFLREALGPNASHTPTMVADLRVGGVERSFDAHFLCVGDAAGHVDPMTGQGIQWGMAAAKLAAERIVQAFAENDFSATFLAGYQRRWMRAFGYSFAMTKWMISLVQRCPTVLDAAANIIRGNGEEFTTAWNLALSGHASKLWFVRPDVGWFILAEAMRLWFLRYFKLSPEYFAPRYRLRSLLRAAVRGDDDI